MSSSLPGLHHPDVTKVSPALLAVSTLEHITNSPKSLVSEALAGLAYLNPKLALTDTTVCLRDPSKSNVSLLCGGGAGHEPAHAAFVGDGMLTAAVSGQVRSLLAASVAGLGADGLFRRSSPVPTLSRSRRHSRSFHSPKGACSALHVIHVCVQ